LALVACGGCPRKAPVKDAPPPARFTAERRAEVQEQIARSSQFWGEMELDAASGLMAYAAEYGEPKLFVASMTGDPRPRRMEAGSVWTRIMSLSPDGKWLVAESNPVTFARRERRRIHALRLYDVATGKGEDLVRGARTNEEVADPSFAPDGRRVVYKRAWREGYDWRFSLNVIDVQTREDKVLLTAPPGEVVRAPAWSPDGKTIAYICSPNVCLVDQDGQNLRKLNALPEGSRAGHRDLVPDRPAFSPDGARVAYAAKTPDDCFRIHVLPVAGGEARVFSDVCGIVPVWDRKGARLAYIQLDGTTRTLWLRALKSGRRGRLGFADGMTYAMGFARDGAVLFHGAPSDIPRAIWRVKVNEEPELVITPLEPPLDDAWIARPRRRPGAPNIEVFPGRCDEGSHPNTAVLWVHPRYDFKPHSWKQEIQYLTAGGVTVVSADYNEGQRLRAHVGMVSDVRALAGFARSIPGIDPQRVFLLHISDVAEVGYKALASGVEVRGLIDWVGDLREVSLMERPESLPPMLWIHGKYDVVTPLRRARAKDIKARGARVVEVDYLGDHIARGAGPRVRALGAVRDFIASLAPGAPCTPR
jgi:dipeptidyl aminopeptidase/acylaminoacyl peptidase